MYWNDYQKYYFLLNLFQKLKHNIETTEAGEAADVEGTYSILSLVHVGEFVVLWLYHLTCFLFFEVLIMY